MSPASELKPYIPQDKAPPEFTLRAFILAAILTVIFGTASGYLGLEIGMTFPASMPAAVLSLAVLRGLFRDSNILESNMVQTQASAGESLMGGVVFMVPALIFLNLDPSILQIAVMTLAGGLLGIFMLIPLRHYLIVTEHDTLPYPEGTACANILKLGEETSGPAQRVFVGMGIGALYNLVSADGLKLFSAKIQLSFEKLWGLTVGMHWTPLMLAIGFLVGPSVGWTMLGGSLLKGVIVVPGLNLGYSQLYNETLSAEKLEFLVRMIGAGAVATGGLISIIRMASQMSQSLKGGLRGLVSARSASPLRIHRDIPAKAVIAGILVALALAVSSIFLSISGEGLTLGFITILISLVLISILGFLFVTLCARLVGIVGTSSYPLSGLTIGALLVSVAILRFSGVSGALGMTTAIVIGAIICMSIAMSADMSQDLKTGALLGATPYRQQIGETLGVLITALFAGSIIMLFHESGELARLPAPQARMMAAIVEGVMADQFQWAFVGAGVLIAVVAEVFGISSILLAVGLYLPVPLSAAWIVGGLVRGVFNQRHAHSEEKDTLERDGTLFASGVIAGWAIMGVLLVGLVALREFDILDLSLALRELPLPDLSFNYLLDIFLSALFYAGTIYYFGKILKLWGVPSVCSASE